MPHVTISSVARVNCLPRRRVGTPIQGTARTNTRPGRHGWHVDVQSSSLCVDYVHVRASTNDVPTGEMASPDLVTRLSSVAQITSEPGSPSYIHMYSAWTLLRRDACTMYVACPSPSQITTFAAMYGWTSWDAGRPGCSITT